MSTEREQLRLSLLRFLANNATERGFSVGLLLQLARSEGRPGLEMAEVKIELQYLEDKKLAVPVNKLVSPENSMWRATAEGRDFWAMNS